MGGTSAGASSPPPSTHASAGCALGKQYSRQTGLPCASCHYAPPELTPFGRTFKLEGYTFTTKPEVSDDKKDHNAALHLLEAFPLSVIFDTSFTATKSPQPTPERKFPVPPGGIPLSGGCLDESYRQFCPSHLQYPGRSLLLGQYGYPLCQ